MSSIKHYIANSTGELDKFVDLISTSLSIVIPKVEKELAASHIDIIFIAAPALAIPEYGIGGNSPGPHHVYVSFDPSSDKITLNGINDTLLHEIHHCIRWRNPGYGETLGEAMISEGMACLYEEEHSGKVPIYAKVDLKDDQIAKANKKLHSKKYDRNEWFFGSRDIDRWFGYSYGYKLCKEYSAKTNKSAAELVNIKAQKILVSLAVLRNRKSP